MFRCIGSASRCRERGENDRLWPRAEVSLRLREVGYGMQSGLVVLALSLSGFDPNQTSDASGSCRMARVPADGLPRIPA